MDERRYRGGMFVPGFRPPGSHMEASQFQYQNTFGFHNILYPPTPSNGNVHFPSGYSSQLPICGGLPFFMSTSTAPMTGVFRAPLTGAYNGFSHDTAGANVSRYPQPVHCWTTKPRYAPATQKHAECVGQEQNLGDSSGTRAPPSIPEVSSPTFSRSVEDSANGIELVPNGQVACSETPITKLSRVARYNKVIPKYELVDEKGPAHRKIFLAKVILTIGRRPQEFFGEANSIKQAQHKAALNALSCPDLRKVPEKTYRSEVAHSSEAPPVARLNALAVKMRSWVDYKDFPSPALSYWSTGDVVWESTARICDKCFNGRGMSKETARNMAARAALEYFDEQKAKKQLSDLVMVVDAVAEEKMKAAVSQVYEKGRRRQQKVSFECISSDGLPHSQTHHVKCCVGTLETMGKGLSKREARQDSAEKMLVEMDKAGIPPAPSSCGIIVERKRRFNPVKRAKARSDYGKNINPITRLYQLQQAKNEPDPVFVEVTPEVQGIKVKDFTVIVKLPSSGDAVGIGPNKRLAKRYAAENMLKSLGCQMQAPPPPKSSLKSTKSAEEDTAENDRKVKFDLENPECDDKQNGRIYRKRFSKFPQPDSMYPKESVQNQGRPESTSGFWHWNCRSGRFVRSGSMSAELKTTNIQCLEQQQLKQEEVLYEATAAMRPGRCLAPGLISLPGKPLGNNSLSVRTISAIARELLVGQKSPIAQKIITEGNRDIDDIYEGAKDDPLHLLEYLCRVVNMSLKHETFSRQGPHSEFSTVLTVGDPAESIGCGGGPTEEAAMKDAAWNLLNVIGEQGDAKEKLGDAKIKVEEFSVRKTGSEEKNEIDDAFSRMSVAYVP